MFCQNCGVENTSDSKYCASCGSKLISQESSTQTSSNNMQHLNNICLNETQINNQYANTIKPSKPMNKKTMIVMGIALVLFVTVYGIFSFVKYQNSPEKVAERYWQDIVKQDWNAAYTMLDMPDNKQFLGKDDFKRYIKANQDESKMKVLKVGKAIIGEKSLNTSVPITFRIEGGSGEYNDTVLLKKQSKKNIFGIDKWKIDVSDDIVSDFSVTVPNGATVYVQGTQLRSKSKDTNDNYYGDCYTIPYLFNCDYDIKVSMNGMETVKDTFQGWDYSYSISEMTPASDLVDTLAKQSESTLETVYTAGINKQSFDEIANLFSDDYKEDNQSGYENFTSALGLDDGVGIYKYNFHDYTYDASSETYDGKLLVYVNLNYNYDVNFTSTDWWSGKTNDSSYSNSTSDQFVYFYDTKSGKWELKSMDFDVVNYY